MAKRKKQSPAVECFFLFAMGTLSMASYGFALGFYSDDWAMLASMKLSQSQLFIDVFSEIFRAHDHEIRPVQFFELAALYKLFGLDPLGYHLVNAAIILIAVVLLYLLGRTLGKPRALALSISVIFMLVPNYSTDRFWIASSAANLSMVFCLIALHAHLQALHRRQPGAFWRWEALAMLGVLGSGFCYEVFLPLLTLAAGFLFALEVKNHGSRSDAGRIVGKAALHQSAIVCAVALILAVKALWATRVPRNLEFIGLGFWTGRQILRAGAINYGYHLLLLPSTVWHVLRHYAHPTIVMISAIIGFAVWVRLYTLPNPLTASAAKARAKMSVYLACGIVLFIAGYSLFPIKPVENGSNNRAAIAGTIGFAVSVTGSLGILASLAPCIWRKAILSTGIALISMGGALIVGVVGDFWTQSFRIEKKILSDIQDHVPLVRAGTSLILDGVCPYNGPAPVFNATWDLSGALSLVYGHDGIEANIVTRWTTVEQNGLAVPTDAGPVVYPFGNLYVYHFGRKTSYALPDAKAAQAYFSEIGPDRVARCPLDVDGNGVDVLNGITARLRELFRSPHAAPASIASPRD